MRPDPIRFVTIALLVAAVSLPAFAHGRWQAGDTGRVRLRLGIFEPDAESRYWSDKFRDFTGSAADLEDTSFGVDLQWRLNRSLSLMFGGSIHDGDTVQAYRDWVDADGFEIRHLTTLETWDLTAILVWQPLRGSSVSPYVGFGGGFLWWRLTESGDFIDFVDPDLPIVTAAYRADGATWETVAVAGVDVPLGYQWSFFGEARWRDADDELGDALADLGTLDLSGAEYSAGFSFRF